MKAQSKDYIQLQNIYKAKARRDIEEVTNSLRSTEADLKRQTPVEAKEIESFCKGAAFVKLIKGKPLPVYAPTAKVPPTSLQNILDDEDSLLPISLAFQAYDHWLHEISNATPQTDPSAPFSSSSSSEEAKHPLEALKHSATQIIDLDAASNGPQINADDIMPRIEPILAEFVRAAGAELHNISAVTGGMVAQEVIKVLTKQYIPIDNTCVFDGIASKSAVFRL